ncbi:MAG: hypothetical protein Q9218_006684 [Villophora microphyllina]
MGRYVQAKLVPQYPELLRKMLGARGIAGKELERLTNDALDDISSEEGIHQNLVGKVCTALSEDLEQLASVSMGETWFPSKY